MKILAINRGSSSIKCAFYLVDKYLEYSSEPIWEAHLQWKNDFEQPFLKIDGEAGSFQYDNLEIKTAAEAFNLMLGSLISGEMRLLDSLADIDVIGHRVVHGGREFSGSVKITEQVKNSIRQLSELAPLHNMADLEGIELLEALCPHVPQVAIFDTAFHHDMPLHAKMYPGTYEWYEEGIQRYGFHGISYQYCSKRAFEMLSKNKGDLKMVICHLGSGASLCAVSQGKSVDTTMGFTPLEGLMMDTRSGSIDPGIIFYLLNRGKTTIEKLSRDLSHASGLLGISRFTSDMREIIAGISQGKEGARLAFDLYVHRLVKEIGAMIAVLQGLDVLVFTAGIGENASLVRKTVCESFSFLGIALDGKENERVSESDREISKPNSKVRVLVVHTKESLEIARECWSFLSKQA